MQTNELAVVDREPARRDVVPARECRCGQALDVCHGAHCSRCGSTLRRS